MTNKSKSLFVYNDSIRTPFKRVRRESLILSHFWNFMQLWKKNEQKNHNTKLKWRQQFYRQKYSECCYFHYDLFDSRKSHNKKKLAAWLFARYVRAGVSRCLNPVCDVQILIGFCMWLLFIFSLLYEKNILCIPFQTISLISALFLKYSLCSSWWNSMTLIYFPPSAFSMTR